MIVAGVLGRSRLALAAAEVAAAAQTAAAVAAGYYAANDEQRLKNKRVITMIVSIDHVAR